MHEDSGLNGRLRGKFRDEQPPQRVGRFGLRHLDEAQPGVERRVEGHVAEGRQGHAGQSAPARQAGDGVDQRPADADAPVIRIDGEFGEVEVGADRPRRGEAHRPVVRPGRDEDVVSGKGRGKDFGRDGRRVGDLRMAVRPETLGRALLHPGEDEIVRRRPRPNPVAGRQAVPAQPS